MNRRNMNTQAMYIFIYSNVLAYDRSILSPLVSMALYRSTNCNIGEKKIAVDQVSSRPEHLILSL